MDIIDTPNSKNGYKKLINRMLSFDDEGQDTSTGFINVSPGEEDPNKKFALWLNNRNNVEVSESEDGKYDVRIESDYQPDLGYVFAFDERYLPEYDEGSLYVWFCERTEEWDPVENADDIWYDGGVGEELEWDMENYDIVLSHFGRVKEMMENIVREYSHYE